MNWKWKGQTIYPYEGFYRRASERFGKGSIGGGQMQDGDFLDCYNQTILRGVSGTILTGISFRCMHYVIEIKDTTSD